MRIHNVSKDYPRRREFADIVRFRSPLPLRAVDDISFDVERGEVLGLAGESGSGKSVLAELIVGLQQPTEGHIYFDGVDIAGLTGPERRRLRAKIAIIFQDPYDSLSPRLTVGRSVSEPLRVAQYDQTAIAARTLEALEQVGLNPAAAYAAAYPHELSGGERQRVGVARALVTKPELIVADEPTTMLDVSVRAGLLNLLREMCSTTNLTMIFISHDFATLQYLCDRLVIIYRGRHVETANATAAIQNPAHPYTTMLSRAIPIPDPTASRPRIVSSMPEGQDFTTGCLFAPRCPERIPVLCDTVRPTPSTDQSGRTVWCHLYERTSGETNPATAGAE